MLHLLVQHILRGSRWLGAEEFPRALVMRGERRKGMRCFFGPYVQAWAIPRVFNLLLRVFPVRTCSSAVFRRAAMQGRPCLLGYIEKCSAPCVGRVSPDAHRSIVMDLCSFMEGDTASTMRRLREQMTTAATNEHFELAARLRDDIAALEGVLGKHAVVLEENVDADLVAVKKTISNNFRKIFERMGTFHHKIGPLSEIDCIHPISFLHIGKVNFKRNYSNKMDFGCVPRDINIRILLPSK